MPLFYFVPLFLFIYFYLFIYLFIYFLFYFILFYFILFYFCPRLLALKLSILVLTAAWVLLVQIGGKLMLTPRYAQNLLYQVSGKIISSNSYRSKKEDIVRSI